MKNCSAAWLIIHSAMNNHYLLPWVRLVVGYIRYGCALFHSRFDSDLNKPQPKTLFVIGCGRSGTTVLGEILEALPGVVYFFEPWHLWAAVDPILDTSSLYTCDEPDAIIDEDSFSIEAQLRFNRLFYKLSKSGNDSIVIEKTPHNAWRIGYLEKLVPNASYLHIVRNGMEVANSIDKLAKGNTYRIAPASQSLFQYEMSLKGWRISNMK